MTSKAGRINWLDRVRGLACLLMLLHHGLYDTEFIFQKRLGLGPKFYYYLHILIVALFISSSALSASQARRQSPRGVKRQVLAATLLLLTTSAISVISDLNLYIFWNLLMVLALARLLLYLLKDLRDSQYELVVMITGILISLVSKYIADGSIEKLPAQADYLSNWPWLFYFIVIYLLFRRFPLQALNIRQEAARDPLACLGRHALLFYFLHQPILLLLLKGLFTCLD
ncbi:MAG: heparan-alpha-glucosaminide N-acetyltransferase domain-containing protein [Eubacteriales bacterium]|nr:heparan-alpha-glucosaminide N-acetyltransferase domain-containing protein [Eubacteriales bacterium]